MPRLIATEYPSTAIERATREFLRSPSPEASESRLESRAEGVVEAGPAHSERKTVLPGKQERCDLATLQASLGLASVTSSRLLIAFTESCREQPIN